MFALTLYGCVHNIAQQWKTRSMIQPFEMSYLRHVCEWEECMVRVMKVYITELYKWSEGIKCGVVKGNQKQHPKRVLLCRKWDGYENARGRLPLWIPMQWEDRSAIVHEKRGERRMRELDKQGGNAKTGINGDFCRGHFLRNRHHI